MEQDLYAAGYKAGYEAGKKALPLKDYIAAVSPIRDLLCEVSEFLDNYTDAEYVDGRPVGNRAMNLKTSVDELIG
jgi:hypothetical protein